MNRYLYFLFFLCCIACTSTAQDWKTVTGMSWLDRTYFSASKMQNYTYLLRDTWIDSSKVAGSDTVFYFYKSLRAGTGTVCLDTLADSWLGSRFIRTAGGTEYYFNRYGDTITIKTQAALGDEWVIAKDTFGTVFKGQVTHADTATIDGQPDSIKTIAIQAYQNNVPVSDWYNNTVLQVSKNHGWTKTLDMYRFPNRMNMLVGWCDIPKDSGQHLRISKLQTDYPSAPNPVLTRYAPGNEWISYEKSGYVTGTLDIVHDSVLGVTILAGGGLQVTMFTKVFHRDWSNLTSTHVDTSYTYQHTEFRTNGNQRMFPLAEKFDGQYASGYFSQCFVDTFCSDRLLVQYETICSFCIMSKYAGCWQASAGVSGYTIVNREYLSGFGLYSEYKAGGEFATPSYEFNYSYLKLGNCVTGTKIDVIALGINETRKQRTGLSLHPNPSSSEVTITTAQQIQDAILTVHDITGRIVLSQPYTGITATLKTVSWSPGVYFIKLAGPGGQHTEKLIVQH